MADTAFSERLPIKLVLPEQGDRKPNTPGRSDGEPFREVDAKFRTSLGNQVSAIQRGLQAPLDEVGVAPVRVKLIPRAYAKSHRPRDLFSENTCPIVGAGQLGELYVKATLDGLAALQNQIESNSAKSMVRQLATVESIEAVTPVLRRKRKSALDVQISSPRIDDEFFLTRVRLFDFGGPEQKRTEADFRRTCEHHKLNVSSDGYRADGMLYIEALSRIVGVRSVIGMPLLRTIRSAAFNAMDAPADLPHAGQVEGDYPIVAVVDSGVTDQVPALESWVSDRRSSVAPEYRNPSHGTFVAGLIIHGDRLNPQLTDVSGDPCGIVDVQVLPNDDPDFGDTEFLLESEFLVALEEALKAHAETCKVWNLSLSTDEVCAEDEFSVLAAELDDLQERYGVTFVIAAGNYNTRPLLAYPREGVQLEKGRITAPADSVLGITVGSISHVHYPDERGPEENEASPFSRHGAGPNHIIKPDLGVRSITERGTGEDIGISSASVVQPLHPTASSAAHMRPR